MLKNREDGQLEKELGVYSIDAEQNNVFSIFAMEDEDNQLMINLQLTCDKEIEDWEYDAIFDYYDSDVFKTLNISVTEEDGHNNPVWKFLLPYKDDIRYVENKLSEIINLHEKEIVSVYNAIIDKKDDYID